MDERIQIYAEKMGKSYNNMLEEFGTIRAGRANPRVLSKITLVGAIFLGIIAVIPSIFAWIFPDLPNLALGGTSILIVVSVALETVRTLESQIMMRHHKGFLE